MEAKQVETKVQDAANVAVGAVIKATVWSAVMGWSIIKGASKGAYAGVTELKAKPVTQEINTL